MDLFSHDELARLIERPPSVAVSLYQPTFRNTPDVDQNPIRFKNLLRDAETRLISGGMRRPEAAAMLLPGHRLLEEPLFWQHPADGLAAFFERDTFRRYRLPVRFGELVVIGERYHVKPLLPLVTGDGRFYILAVSQNDVRLFQGSRHGVSEVDLASVPRTLREALKYDSPEKQLQWHTGASRRGAKRAAMFHGHGTGVDDTKDRVLRFFREIDGGLHEYLHNSRAPLVFAGVDHYFPIYREANTYSNLVDAVVPGNPEMLRPDELHQAAWSLVQPLFESPREEALGRYRALAGTGRTSADIGEVLNAAHEGRVDSLLLDPREHCWGRFHRSERVAELHDATQPGDEDLLDLAVTQTLAMGGNVHTVERSRMPAGEPLAALFRY